VPELRFTNVSPDGGDDVLVHWQHVHNMIIPTAPLSVDEIRVRAVRNHLTVTYHDDTLVGCSTVRPPDDDRAAATVIVRVLPEHRRKGFGQRMYTEALAMAYGLGARVIETVVLATNEDGLRFAARRGYVETERYVVENTTIPFVDLRLTDTAG
jgi:GNAT superfamily N-acetyltransferase